ncbi:Putative pentatricopeptide repeat-containing protein At1g64310 [Linum perenne]
MILRFNRLLSELSQTHQSSSRTKQLHAFITRTHLFLDPFFATKLVRLHARNGNLRYARQLFDKSPQRSVYLWNSIIRAYAQAHMFGDAFHLYRRMIRAETQPDCFTYACILRACRESFDADGLRIVHGELVVSGFGFDSVACSALVTGYSKVGLVGEARKVFNGLVAPDLVIWNAMISGFCYEGFWNEGLQLFNEMRRNGDEKPDGYSFVGLIWGFLDSNLLGIGQGIHGLCLKSGVEGHDHVSSSLVTMYSRFKFMNSAHGVFSSLHQPDFVTCSSLITGYLQSGEYEKGAVQCRKLISEGKKLDHILVASLLVAAARAADIGLGTQIHGYVVRQGLESDVMVSSSLIDVYSKCGFVGLGIQLFRSITNVNITSYNTAISSLGLNGLASQAFELFEEASRNGLEPDESTFSALLCTCCHAGLVNHGREIFKRMQDEFHIGVRTEHCVHYVKLLGMAGFLGEAYKFILSLGQPVDSGIWGALLSCCDAYGDSELAEVIAQHLFSNEQRNGAYRVMMSNMYASDGKWEDVRQMRDVMTNAGVNKTPALSMVAVEGSCN